MENVIIKSERYKLNVKATIISISVGIILLGLVIFACGEGYSDYWDEWYSVIDAMFDPFSLISGLLIDLGLLLLPITLIIAWWLSSAELTVTDKRVYGKAAFGKRVDLPLDSISSVGTSLWGGVDVGTSSGCIKFKLIKNQEKVHDAINNLLIERQQKAKSIANEEQTHSSSQIDDLKKYKELLDSGIITQEEFDAKKKQLLDL